jgi:hypothetical protein
MGRWWRRIIKVRNGLAALGLWVAVLILPLTLEQLPEAFRWWGTVMPSRETLLIIISGLLVACIFWTDLRPSVYRWWRTRKPNLSRKDEILAILDDAFKTASRLSIMTITNDNELKALESAVDKEVIGAIQRKLKGLVPEAEINALLTSTGGQRSIIRGCYGREHENILHYLRFLVESLHRAIEKHS